MLLEATKAACVDSGCTSVALGTDQGASYLTQFESGAAYSAESALSSRIAPYQPCQTGATCTYATATSYNKANLGPAWDSNTGGSTCMQCIRAGGVWCSRTYAYN